MKIEIISGITVLSPDDGYSAVTNGETITTQAWLGKFDSPSNWHDTNDVPPTPEEPIPDSEALTIITGGEAQ